MPTVDPMNYLMSALEILTGGLINDMKTLILGLVVCAFILMALDILKDLLLVPLAAALLDPVEGYKTVRGMVNKVRIANLSPAPSMKPVSRADVEITPLRQYDLDLGYRGVDSLPASSESIYDQSANNWERDGVELSEDRYQELDMAMQEAESMRRR